MKKNKKNRFFLRVFEPFLNAIVSIVPQKVNLKIYYHNDGLVFGLV